MLLSVPERAMLIIIFVNLANAPSFEISSEKYLYNNSDMYIWAFLRIIQASLKIKLFHEFRYKRWSNLFLESSRIWKNQWIYVFWKRSFKLSFHIFLHPRNHDFSFVLWIWIFSQFSICFAIIQLFIIFLIFIKSSA